MNINKNQSNMKERGAVTVVAIFAILLVTVIGFALVTSGMVSNGISKSSREQTKAYYIAEAGLRHSIQLMQSVSPAQYTTILLAGDGVPNTGDELSTQPAGNTPIPAAGIAFGAGRYFVSVKNDPSDAAAVTDTNKKLILTSLGMGEDGSSVTMEALVFNDSFNRIGMLADGDIVNSNVATVTGPDGYIQANGTFSTSSTVCAVNTISQGTSTAMNLSKLSLGAACATAPVVGTNVFYAASKIAPDIYDRPKLQSKFRPQADYIFKADGTIWSKSLGRTMLAAERTAAGFAGWTKAATSWSYSSSTILSSYIYYFEGADIKITNGGSSGTPPQLTLICEGSIEISNGPTIQPKLPGYGIVSANDVKISSTSGIATNPGLIYAYGQMEVTNTSVVYGWLEAANYRQADGTNGADTANLNYQGQNLVAVGTGALRLSNKTTVNTPLNFNPVDGLVIISSREVRF